jgi:hypothetical protein
VIRVDVLRLLRDFHVPHADGALTRRPDWVHVHCPFCAGVPDWHLGYNLRKGYWNCWRCGGKSWERVARALAGLSYAELLARYGREGEPGASRFAPLPAAERPLRREAVLPLGCGPMGERHRDYLAGRGFDPERLEREWGLLGTGLTGPDKLRVVAPVPWRGRTATWQGRDVTGKAKAKYRACPPEMEARPIKSCLYGLERADPERGCLVVEGIADAWRMGAGAVATFGTEWTLAQANLLLPFARVFVLFDSGEEAARRHSDALCAYLVERGVPVVEQLDLGEGDPGELTQNEADHIMKEVGLR